MAKQSLQSGNCRGNDWVVVILIKLADSLDSTADFPQPFAHPVLLREREQRSCGNVQKTKFVEVIENTDSEKHNHKCIELMFLNMKRVVENEKKFSLLTPTNSSVQQESHSVYAESASKHEKSEKNENPKNENDYIHDCFKYIQNIWVWGLSASVRKKMAYYTGVEGSTRARRRGQQDDLGWPNVSKCFRPSRSEMSEKMRRLPELSWIPCDSTEMFVKCSAKILAFN